jgi:hypothetical protein
MLTIATSRKVAGSSPDEVIDFFQFTYSFQPHHVHDVYSAYSRNEYQKIFMGVKRGRRVMLTAAIYMPIVYKMWDTRHFTTL